MPNPWQYQAKSDIAVSFSGWSPVLAIKESNFWALYNLEGYDMLLCTDPADASTKWPLKGGTQESVVVPYMGRGTRNQRYSVGDVIIYAKLDTLSDPPGGSHIVLKMP